jgi:hypothetical protein
VRLDEVPTREYPIATSAQIIFLKDSLTSFETKVFDAWQKNAEKYR